MTYYNRFKDYDIQLRGIKPAAVDGEFKLEAFKGFEFPRDSGNVYEYPGTRRLLQDWHHNKIVNQGLEFYGGDGMDDSRAYCYVGTSNAALSNTQTQLVAPVAYAAKNSDTQSAQSSAPYYGLDQTQYLFNPNFGPGNINLNEIGVGTGTAYTTMTARSLTVDGAGVPKTLSVDADEYLHTYYRRRNYPGHITEATGVPTDDTGVVNVQGTDYTYTIRPAVVTVGGTYDTGTGQGWGTGTKYPQAVCLGYNVSTAGAGRAYKSTTVIGAVTASPTNPHSLPSPTLYGESSYTGGTYTRELWWEWGINNANDAGGIGGLLLKTRMGAYQLVFTSAIPKVYGDVFRFHHNFAWTRKETWV